MTFTAIVSGIFAIAKAVPKVMELIDQIVVFYIKDKVSKINIERITKDDQRSALLKAIAKAETNEELISLSVTLHNLNND